MKKNESPDLEKWAKTKLTPDEFPIQRNLLHEQSARQRYVSSINKINQAVSFSVTPSLNRIKRNGFHFSDTQKEFKKMIGQLIAALALIATLLGGTGAATVYASQTSLPGEFLYPVKTWSEEVQLDLTADAEEKITLSLDLTDRRLDEIQQLLESDVPVDPSVLVLLEKNLDRSLNLLGQSIDSNQSLDAVKTRLMTQQQWMENAIGTQDEPLKLQIREMLQTRIQVVDMVMDQSINENQIQNQNQQQYQTPGTKEPLKQQQQFQETAIPNVSGNQSMEITQMPGETNSQQGQDQGNSPVHENNSQGNSLRITLTPNGTQQKGAGNGKP